MARGKLVYSLFIFILLAFFFAFINKPNEDQQDNLLDNSSSSGLSQTIITPNSGTQGYTKEELKSDPKAPSKNPQDYNSNGEYVPKNGVSKNPADYNAKGEYKPVESMTKEEKRKELEEMLNRVTK